MSAPSARPRAKKAAAPATSTIAPTATPKAPVKRKARPGKSAPVARWVGREAQPLARIEWVHRDSLHANNYNPNHVAPVEMRLLKTSILEDGWTQPIVKRDDGEIVDGFHRWTISGDPDVYAMTEGYVPTVTLHPAVDRKQQQMSTIRHNRARGSHGILPMADIVRNLIDNEGCTYEEVMERLGMEWEEVDRLYDRGGMRKRGSREGFNAGWVPGD